MPGQPPRLTITILVAMAAAFAVVIGLFLVLDRSEAPAIVIADPLASTTVTVSVEGAVVSPGLYELSANARVSDAIAAAGGTTSEADVASLNLAQRVVDEQRVIVQFARTAATPSTGLININTATADELDELPGIGPSKAEAIVAYRTTFGAFETVDDLLKVDGISESLMGDIRPLITVGP